jgi:hypothetical protein
MRSSENNKEIIIVFIEIYVCTLSNDNIINPKLKLQIPFIYIRNSTNSFSSETISREYIHTNKQRKITKFINFSIKKGYDLSVFLLYFLRSFFFSFFSENIRSKRVHVYRHFQ